MRHSRPISALICCGLVAGITGCADYSNHQPSNCTDSACIADSKITDDVLMRLQRTPELHPPGMVHVQTVNSVVYLTGDVPTASQRDAAELSARKTPGVASVVNNINVRADAAGAS
jgi:osmotically-inducible protein OsmY